MKLNDFNITRLSPSSLAAWANSPCLWTLKYLYGWKEAPGPAAARGLAIEGGLHRYLHRPLDDIEAIHLQVVNDFEINLQGEIGDAVDRERLLLRPMLEVAIRGAQEKGLTKPQAYQLRCTAVIPGVPVELTGYIDIVMGNGDIIELKTTKRIPSHPHAGHLSQGAFYRYARAMAPLELMYVSDRRVAFHRVEDVDVDRQIGLLREHAKSLLACLDAFRTPEAMLAALPPSGVFQLSREAHDYRKQVLLDRAA